MRPGMTSFFFAATAAVLFLVACGGGGDDSSDNVDARRIDAASVDAPDTDGADIDAPDIDAAVDAPTDARIDAPTDAIPTSSEWILFARQAPDGANQSLPIMGATVTYLKPAIGNDPAGFTIQAEQLGPALMVAVDPSTLTPAPVVGDVVSFTITTMATVSGQRRATAISGFARDSQGANVGALAQNVTAATNLVTAIDSYESEILDLSGTMATNFAAAGSGFESAQITTTGMMTADPAFVIRVPSTLRSATDMVMGCQFTIDNTPIQKFIQVNPPLTMAQTSAFVAGDITLSNCPAPIVMAAVALSATQVRITFSRNILASSVNVNGSQFSIDNGLNVIAASVSGRTVTLTTGLQTSNTVYTVMVANTVTDLQGTMLGTPNMATFAGFVTLAGLKINEINANVTDTGPPNIANCDLIELRVVSSGTISGFVLKERTGASGELNFTFPAINVVTNDIIVVHVNAGATCNPGSAVNETTGIAQQPRATFGANFDTAYDLYATDNGLTNTDNTFTLFDNATNILDCVLSSDDVTGTAAAASETAAATCVTASQWQNVGGGTPAGGYVDDAFSANAVQDLNGTATTWAGSTMQRLDNTDDNDKADWNNGADIVRMNTWGLINVGQTPLP
jgi:hypothetical protein